MLLIPELQGYTKMWELCLYAKTVPAFSNHLTRELSGYSNIITTSNLQQKLVI